MDDPGTRMSYRVPYADTDQMSVVYYANFFEYFERVRNEMLRARGYPYKQMEAEGYQLPVIEAHCDYRQPARYDDLLEFIGWAEAISPTRLRVRCEVRRDGELLASGHTIHVCFATKTGRPTRLPPVLGGARRVAGNAPRSRDDAEGGAGQETRAPS